MTAIALRSTVVGLMHETTEGTPVFPAAATDFIKVQGDLDIDPGLQFLENAEIGASLAPTKPTPTGEQPKASFSHYWRHSGTEGTAPNYGKILESLLGTKVANGTQRVTAASSTVALIKAATGTGGDFVRGTPLLIKDATNGYRIRAAFSRSTDDITLGFTLPTGTAPGTGVSLGKAVTYSPANSGHKSMTLARYLGNGGALQAVSGLKVTDLDVQFKAKEAINAKFSLAGLLYYENPITITSSTKYIDWTDDANTFAASVATGTYQTPKALADALAAAMNAANSALAAVVTYNSSDGKFTIKGAGTLLSILWNTGTNTANSIAAKIGFSTAADNTGTAATTGYTSATAQTYTAPYTPTYDTATMLVAKDNEMLLGDSTDYACFAAREVGFKITNTAAENPSVCAVSGIDSTLMSERKTTLTVKALLNKYDADKIQRMREGTTTRAQYTFGSKVGGNWEAGKSGCIFAPTLTVKKVKVSVQDGQYVAELELEAYGDDSGNGEVYIGFV